MKSIGVSIKEVAKLTKTSRHMAAWAIDDARIAELHEQQLADTDKTDQPEKFHSSQKPSRSCSGMRRSAMIA